MTGPAAGEPDRGARAPARTSTTRGPASAILIVLALGLVLRVIIAYLLPGSGFGVDLNAFRFWADDLARHGPFGFYERGFFADYTPGYLYVLWLVGIAGQALGGIGDLIKVPAIVADLALGYLIHSMILELGGSYRRALLGAAVFLALPITWFDSVVWGQVDSVGVVFLLLGLRALWRDQPERATAWATIAAVTKPQLGILIPILAAVLVRRWLVDRRAPSRLVTSTVTALAVAGALSAPFGLSLVGLIGQVVRAAAGYPYLTVNAYNPWALLELNGNGLAANGTWINDATVTAGQPAWYFGPLPAVVVGTALLLLAIGAICLVVARRPDRLTILVGLAVMAVAFFVVPTRVHERYLFPFLPLGAILVALSARWRLPYVAITTANFLNLYVVLTTLYPDNPGIADWLGIGPLIRSPGGVVAIAFTHLVVFGWALAQLHRPALERLEDEAEEAGLEPVRPGPGAPAGPRPVAAGEPAASWLEPAAERPSPVAQPHPSAAGAPLRWLLGRPIRPDRSRLLHGEGGGRLDRLDLWVVVVLAIAVLAGRMYRLEEPYQMHFDEVYHARTATEFLQFWRYGEPHAIYEWTHPHLAKYAIAAGIVAFGNDRVTARSELGVPVRDALVEPRWDDPRLPRARAGDRLYVATGSEVRAYDLASRALVATLPLPGAISLGLDQARHRLFVGTETGTIEIIDTAATFDSLRPGPSAPLALPADRSGPFATIGAPVTHLLATDDGLSVLAAASDELVSLDGATGAELGRVALRSISGLTGAGTGDSLVAHPAEVADPSAAAELLAGELGGEAAAYRALLAGKADPAVIAPAPAKDVRDRLDAAIADGRLAGFEFVSLPRIAVGTAAGVAFVAPSTATVVDEVRVDGGVTGLALASGLDSPKIYAAGGSSLTVIDLGRQGDPTLRPVVETTVPMPGSVRDVRYDPASLMVHVLGRTPDGSSATIYVVEPHANAVYADARLPFEPAAWATDVAPLYPAEDRQSILAFSAAGSSAAVEIGSHAFAWRLPGVLAGTLTAVLIYLLARILFRRRAVAVLAGLFTLVDGMLFVQSRIAMNDVYVGLFIVAAYLLFAGLWLGRWRARWAFWVLMPAIGVLLGLALASKWVALYAIAGLGVLVLARSALGRILLIGALVVGSAVLGLIAVSVPPDATSGGNLTFMFLMIALTLVAVVVAVLHPIAWTLEEVRFAIGAPIAAGVALLLVALPLGLIGPRACDPATGACSNPPILEVAFALVVLGGLAALAFRLAARLGFGPLAPPAATDDPARRLPPAAPPPVGWLRPGWGLGLPMAWLFASLVLLPVVVYVGSYLPWVALGNRLTETWPPGNTGQTLLDLTRSMYDYHNNLRATHAAASPWWAWPFDLKPVWFYQGGFAAGTAGAIYDAGNIVLWWLSVPAMAFAAWQAYRRRSLALALVAIAFAWQWISWARIDRATFQYHYYTSLPFVLIAVAYFLAELWHGASARTWLLARAAAAVAILGPALLWLGRGPLCALARVTVVNPGSQACIATAPGEIVLTARTAGLILVMGPAIVAVAWQLLRLELPDRPDGSPDPGRRLRHLAFIVGLASVGVVLVGLFLDESVLVRVVGFSPEVMAVGLFVPLSLAAWFVFSARDARRFVAGVVWAAVAWFVLWYPNIAALPVPSAFVNWYQGVLPTYLYPFQFAVNTDPAGGLPKLLGFDLLALLAALAVTSLVVAWSARAWRLSTVVHESDEEGPLPTPGDRSGADGP
ncbi:MAG: phospholipid carrier-dependent glycosyltransferase [Chloroflexota bacterium]